MKGKRFGLLRVIRRVGLRGKNVSWLCKCDCGNTHEALAHHLTRERGGTRSCGCLKKSLMQGKIIRCKRCDKDKSIKDYYRKGDSTKTRHNTCKECLRPILCEKRKERNARDRLSALQAYSGKKPKCACCGEKHIEFLTIDHVNGGGGAHRRSLGRSSGVIYRWLRDRNYPEGFRVLCINCNWSMGLYGYCPHERRKLAREA